MTWVATAAFAITVRAAENWVDPALLDAEARRVEIVERVSRPTIAVIEPSGKNGGSGVIISADGYAVTNFHVVAPAGPHMIVGLSNGQWTDAVLVGIDPTGDIALIKLLGEGPYPIAEWGDSDLVQVGDEAIVAGNPFMLAEDFSPSISFGVISGVRRYQYPSDSILEYADCLQTDAAINPGNSGGPLFSREGKLIGINGRGSFEKRGRVNVGVGYAVSSNQVRRFLPMLRSGLIVDHASFGATVRTIRSDATSHALVDAVDTASDVYRRGLGTGDYLLSVDGREIRSANNLLNVVGAMPAGWRAPFTYERRGVSYKSVARLQPLHLPGELYEAASAMQSDPAIENLEGEQSEWRRWYESVEGFANHYFTRLETDRILNAWAAVRSDPKQGAQLRVLLERKEEAEEYVLDISRFRAQWRTPTGRYHINAQKVLSRQPAPLASPGLLAGLWIWRTISINGAGAVDSVHCLGSLPWDASGPVLDVVRVNHLGARVEFYFRSDGRLAGFESFLDQQSDPTRVEFSDEIAHGLPAVWRIFQGDEEYAVLRVSSVTSQEGAAP